MSKRNEQPLFHALSDPTRRELLEALVQQDGQTATELAAERSISRQGISKHLTILAKAGLVTITKQGRDKRYHFVPDALSIPVDWVNGITQQWDRRLHALSNYLTDLNDS